MSRWETWLVHSATIIVSVSGIVYLWMKYFMTTLDPFSVINHPLQPLMLDIHILSAPCLILAFGMMVKSHIAQKLSENRKTNRRSGLVAMFSFVVMALSGYLLQVSAHPAFLRGILMLHLASGFLFMATYVTHQVTSFLAIRQDRIRRQLQDLHASLRS